MDEEAPAIGIDLGTTNTCAAVLINDQVTLIHGDDGGNTTASFVFFKNLGERLVGNMARDEAYRNPKNGIFGVKRFIGRSYKEFKNEKSLSMFPYKVENINNTPKIVVTYEDKTVKKQQQKNASVKTMEFTPEEVSAMVLMKMKDRAKEKIGKEVTKAVITVPAHFNGTQRQATIDAGRIAGLEVLRVINEPTAAILAFEINSKYKERTCNVLVYDFGGGTFDVTIATACNDEIQVRASNGEAFLGGDDLNNNLIEYFVDRFREKHNVDLKTQSSKVKGMHRLRQQAEKTKRILSQNYHDDICLDCIDDYDNSLELSFSRAVFQNINMELFNKTLKCIEKSLDEAKMKKEDIDEILLVGGSTRIPYVKQLVQDYFGKEPNASVHPDEVVAIGAARQAAISSGKNQSKALTAIKLSDICSLSLGTDLIGGIMSVIIPRNSKIPTKATKTYFTTSDNQPTVGIEIYEGERSMFTDNQLLSKFDLNGIRLAPAGEVKIDVTFEIDESGVLTATAAEIDTNNSSKITVSIYKNNLSEAQIGEMLEKAKKFKAEDELKKDIALLKYELSEKCTKYKNKISNLLNVPMRDKNTVLKYCNEANDWLETNSSFTNMNNYKVNIEKKVEEIDEKCTAILVKYN